MSVRELQRMAEEAAREVRDLPAGRCWILHQWTMWRERVKPGHFSTKGQSRRCIRCGRVQTKDLK